MHPTSGRRWRSSFDRQAVHRHLFLLFILASAATLRCYEIGLPYLKLHETGFQETLALNHLEHGVVENGFLSVLAVVDSAKYYHVSHPPLLQNTLAITFSLFGPGEATARLTVLPFSLGTILLVYLCASKQLGTRVGKIAACFMTFSLLASYFGRIVNFEVLAQFFAILFYFQFLRYRERPGAMNLALLAGVFFLGCLSDWPFYFILPGVVLFVLADRESPSRFRDLVISSAFLGFGLLAVFLYAGYQELVTGNMVLAGHGRNRAAPALLMDLSFYKLLLGRLFEYAPFLTFLAPVGFILGLGRRRKVLLAVLPLLFVPLAYAGIFAQAAKAHAWALYYFAPPMSILAAFAIDRALGCRDRVKVLVCGVLVVVLAVMNVRFHEVAKRGIFSELYDLSVFLRNHLPEDSVVFSAIFCQVSYYLGGRAEVLFPLAKGDLARHEYDCYILDRLFENPYRRQDVQRTATGGDDRWVTVLESSRYQLVCDRSVVSDALFLRNGPVSKHHLVRLGEAVHVAHELPISTLSNMVPLRVAGPAADGIGGSLLSFQLGVTGTPDLDLVVWQSRTDRRVEILRSVVEAEGEGGEWRSFEINLPTMEPPAGDLEFAVVGVRDAAAGSRVYLGDPRVVRQAAPSGEDPGP